MTAYLLTPEQHAQIVGAAESNAEYAEAEYLDRREFWGDNLSYRWENLKAASAQAKATLAMLKAMKPVEQSAWIGVKQPHGWPTFHSVDYVRDYIKDTSGMTPLYTLGDTA